VGEASNGLLFLLAFLAARSLTPMAFGQYSAAFAFVGLFRILPDFGMSYASTLQVSRDRTLAGRIFGGLLGFQAVLSILTVVLCLALGRMLFDGVTWFAVVVLSADLVLKCVKSTLRWLLKGFERFGAEAASLLLERRRSSPSASGACAPDGASRGSCWSSPSSVSRTPWACSPGSTRGCSPCAPCTRARCGGTCSGGACPSRTPAP
jgi:hypothetical protein